MTVNITLICDGCFAETGPHRLPHRQFHSFSGRGHGFGVWDNPTIADVVPAGWVQSDPYTGCTYCPKCWAEIEAESSDAAQAATA